MIASAPHPATAARVSVAGLGAWLALFAAVQIALVTPGREALAASAAGAGLDYTRVAGTVAPLTDAFIDHTLGLSSAPGAKDASTPLLASAAATGSVPESASRPPSAAVAVNGPGGRLVVNHPPDNDDFTRAYEAPSVPFTARTDARTASRQSGEPSSCSPVGPTLWYRYTAQRTTGLVATTVGTSRTASLGVFAGSGLDDLRRVGCDTDVGGDAHVAFEAVEGATYHFQVTAPAGGGPTVFTLDPAGVTERISLNSEGEEIGAARYWLGATSADGRFVAFQSLSSELVPDDTNRAWDVFVKDRLTGAVERVSVASDGTEGNDHNGAGGKVAISADGRFVAFYSWASNLVPDDTNDEQDAFVHDRLTRETTRVSVSSSGRQGEKFAAAHTRTPYRAECQLRPRDAPLVGHQHFPCIEWVPQTSITADGCVVVFESAMLGLIDGEDQEAAVVDASRSYPPYQVYAHDRCVRETTRVSVDAAGAPGNGASSAPAVSTDGRMVVFESVASNLVPGVDPDGTLQLFLSDRVTGEMRFVSRSVDGGPSNGRAFEPDISGDGRVVVFASLASDLVAGDRNAVTDVFAYDVASGSLELVSVSTEGEQQQVERDATQRTGFGLFYAFVSDDGRYVAFDSPADNLSARDGARAARPTTSECFDDVFLRDRHASTTLLVSVNSRGEQANNCSYLAGLSPDGADLVFLSPADNLVDDDTNGGTDLFVHFLGGGS